MKYSKNDLENIIAICEQDEGDSKIAKNLAERCRRSLAYRDVPIRLTKNDRQYLTLRYDSDMDEGALLTLNKIMEL